MGQEREAVLRQVCEMMYNNAQYVRSQANSLSRLSNLTNVYSEAAGHDPIPQDPEPRRTWAPDVPQNYVPRFAVRTLQHGKHA